MKTAYISVSFRNRPLYTQALAAIAEALASSGITPFVFVDHYTFDASQERPMMRQAMKDIERSDLFIAETSDKAIGVGVEAGFAKAKGKPVIYLRHKDAAHSSTVAGISDFQIIYTNDKDLKQQLIQLLKRFTFNGCRSI
ncbi:MAG: nucleoside 2-deoxyribosyltransferase [Niabella sp.]|nr:nucleoside 2-deoxyribosyltransferase [Niabella sp.]